MSRIGKIPVALPKDVKIAIEKDMLRLEGSKGKMSLKMLPYIQVEQKDAQLLVTRTGDIKQARANQGTFRALLLGMIEGVSKGHKRDLEIQGVGFRAQIQGTKLILNLGFSHPVEFEVPKDVKVSVPQPTSITIEGLDKAVVGEVAAKIRRIKPPEPYKGKGIRYSGEYVRRKQGKSVTK
ncbi:MAG: 50S ribosomal protein L6 [Candidatus Omnitrophota bacterium]|nr:50S ribosomal protein L6 [Candidatus Omnitrophota bacterium]MDZ4242909.1 50S ribosomal protein L6 [Candidatus Omnitrophota bacterium]